MESNVSAEAARPKERSHLKQIWTLVRAAIGLGLLAALLYWQSIDLNALAPLREELWSLVAAVALIFCTLPIGALRWAIVLRVLDIALHPASVFHIQCIGASVNLLLLGPSSGDTIRGVYAWRKLRFGAGRIAISIVVDRALGLIALCMLALVVMPLRWQQVHQVPQLMLLAISLTAAVAAGVAGSIVLIAAPRLLALLRPRLYRFPRAAQLAAHAQDVFLAFRHKPAALLAAFCLAMLGQCVTLLAFLVIAGSLHIGTLSASDYSVAAPLAFVANTLPFTPGGLGVGEAAFAQLCRWLEPISSTAPYASIFFAFRAVSMLTLLVGLISFVVYRSDTGRAGAA
jgi:glycosyltransferase 2 family protein